MAIDEYTGDALKTIGYLIDETDMDIDQISVDFYNHANNKDILVRPTEGGVTESDVMSLSDGEPSEDGLDSTVNPALVDAFNAILSLDSSYDFEQCEDMLGASDIGVMFLVPSANLSGRTAERSLDAVMSVINDPNIDTGEIGVTLYDWDGYNYDFRYGDRVTDEDIEAMYDMESPEVTDGDYTVDSLREMVQEVVDLETPYAPLGYSVTVDLNDLSL